MIDTILNNRYRLDAVIGQGGMAVVYRGYDLLLRRQVAVKVLRPQHAADQTFVQRFYEEARAAAKLSHPNIVNTYDVGEVDGSHYIVEEYVAGETLSALIAREGKLPEAVALRYARQICLALGAAHRADLLHRDIKPSNVLITPEDTVRVTDFGIARAANTATLSGVEAIMGSIPYCSPEQLSAAPLAPSADLYSLGVVLFEMVTGRPPFMAETAIGVAMAHVNSPIPNPMDCGARIDDKLSQIIVKLLAKNPADRYQSAGEALAALRACGRRDTDYEDAQTSDASTAVLRRRALPVTVNGPEHEILEPAPTWNVRRLVGASVFCVVAIVLAAIAIALGRSASQAVVLPDVSGKSQVEAIAALHDAGIDRIAFYQRQDASVPAGLVDGADPPLGSRLSRGDRVTLYLSSGPSQILMPNLSGVDPKSALAALTSLGLDPKMGMPVHSPIRQGLVAHTSPAVGSPIAKGATVIVFPSSGPSLIAVPNIVAATLDQARSLIAKLGLKLSVNIVPSVDIPARTVIDQDPPGGTNAQPGSTVTIDVSGGPSTVAVPNLVGTSLDDARAALEQTGLALGNVAYASVQDTSPGTIIGQHPDANSQAPEGSSVDVVIAQAPASPQPQASAVAGSPSPAASVSSVSVPNVVGMTLSDAESALGSAGLVVSQVSILPGSPPNAKVVRTNPPAGSSVPQGTAVTIVLGSAK
jgi:beta-lactam-binding protein with PASTA domain/tRNA A-37 threonylcarbamoyl transferase component Bud32